MFGGVDIRDTYTRAAEAAMFDATVMWSLHWVSPEVTKGMSLGLPWVSSTAARGTGLLLDRSVPISTPKPGCKADKVTGPVSLTV